MNGPFKINFNRGATIAQWIRMRLPSCCPGFESQAHHPCFSQFIFDLCHVEKMKINKKECREVWPIKKNHFVS